MSCKNFFIKFRRFLFVCHLPEKLQECVEIPNVVAAFGGLLIHAITKEALFDDMLLKTVWKNLGLDEMSFSFRVSCTATRTPPCFFFASSDVRSCQKLK